MRLNLMLLLMLAVAAAGNTQVMPGDSVVVPAAEDLAENARLAAERLRQIGPRLPSESEDPDAPPPSQLPVTSTFFGPAYRVSLSRNPKNTMYLPDSFEADCPLIAGDLVSMNYIDNDPYKPVIGPRASGGDWCTVSHPPGMYTGPCSINRPRPAVGEFRPSLAVVRRSTTT